MHPRWCPRHIEDLLGLWSMKRTREHIRHHATRLCVTRASTRRQLDGTYFRELLRVATALTQSAHCNVTMKKAKHVSASHIRLGDLLYDSRSAHNTALLLWAHVEDVVVLVDNKPSDEFIHILLVGTVKHEASSASTALSKAA